MKVVVLFATMGILATSGTENAVRNSSLAVAEQGCGGTCGGLCFGTWNIQNLGVSKDRRSAVMGVIKRIISRYDVIVIQELSQTPSGSDPCGANTGSVICDSIPSSQFGLEVSERSGDEQYVIMFNKTRVDISSASSTLYPDPNQKHARPPAAWKITDKVSSPNLGTIAIGTTHTAPSKATEEISNFPAVTAWMQDTFGADHNLLAGDYNGGGSYFADHKLWPNSVLQNWPGYKLLTGNGMDTTVAKSSNAYDRIVVSNSIADATPTALRLDDPSHIDLSDVYTQGCSMGYAKSSICNAGSPAHNYPPSASVMTELAKEISDHFPVEVCLEPASQQRAEWVFV